ncbi:MAG TPA: AMP-binding protein [bacterium]|nr:AMP-binding protein [bacterium]
MLNKRIAEAKNIPEAFIAASDLFSDYYSMRFKTSPADAYSGKYTYKQYPAMSRIMGTVLAEEFGLEPDMKVCYISENRPEYNIGDLGTMFAGGVSWGLYDYDVKTPDVIEYKLNDSETTIIATSPTFLESIRSVVKSGKTAVKHIIVMDTPYDSVKCLKNETPFSEILTQGIENSELLEKRLENVGRDSVARLIYTSGTTGKPKGVMLTHENLMSNCESCSTLLDIEPGERLISYLPEAHSFQGFVTLCMLFNGGEVWYSHKKTIVDDVRIIEPTMFPGVPLVFKRFAEGMTSKVLELTKGHIDLSADYSRNPIKSFLRGRVLGPMILKKAGLSKIVRAVSGSAKLELDHARTLENVGFIVLEGYGISETSPVISTEKQEERRRGSVGKPIPGCDVKILSFDCSPDGKRKELPANERGEVACKGPNVFKGYYRDEQKTKTAFYDGYYLTGDLGHFDSDGFLYIHGRCGLQVKMANGEFVDLDELAADILRHTSLIQAAAVDAELKEFAVAVVSLQWEPESLAHLGDKLGVPFKGDPVAFASHEIVVDAVKKEIEDNIQKFGKGAKAPKKFLIVAPMSPETGEITSTMKFRVRNILDKYKTQIDQLRKSDQKFMVHIK